MSDAKIGTCLIDFRPNIIHDALTKKLKSWVLVGGVSYCMEGHGFRSCILDDILNIFFSRVASSGCCITEWQTRKYIRRVITSG